MSNHLYHGTNISGLTHLVPRETVYGRKLVYATPDPIFAAIFTNRPGGSLVQATGRDPETGIPYLVERKESTIETNYAGRQGSIYSVLKDRFHQHDGHWQEEWVSANAVEIVDETVIYDLREHLLALEQMKAITIVYFQDRWKHFAGTDDQLVRAALVLVERFGAAAVELIERYQPQLFEDAIARGTMLPNRGDDPKGHIAVQSRALRKSQ
jgi:hypothetical protein